MLNLGENWHLFQSEAREYNSPEKIPSNAFNCPAFVPGTVAQALKHAQIYNYDNAPDYDAFDWWYQIQFDSKKTEKAVIIFEGLATIAEVWLNNKLILTTDNMFIQYSVNIQSLLKSENILTICFRSINEHLESKRPRPRWKTKIVKNQQLRWLRTTLLGRIPGWTPPVAPIGPWKNIYIQQTIQPEFVRLTTDYKKSIGYVEFECSYKSNKSIISASLDLNGERYDLTIEHKNGTCLIKGKLEIHNVKLWNPHTHGSPFLYPVALSLKDNSNNYLFTLPNIGFKQVELLQRNNQFSIIINGIKIFCRGACWTVNDIYSINGNVESLRNLLLLMRSAGANILRIGGTMLYEQELFYDLCDELGIMVWQDFMFANMDYPFEDEKFRVSVNEEVQQQLIRFSHHPCIILYCGNSEIEQQVTMLGYPENVSYIRFFQEDLANQCKKINPQIPYITSTPTGSQPPFRTNAGVSHYYGIGAYMASISELRNHQVKFTSECLGFANIPVPSTRNQVLEGQLPATHHPQWKKRTVRDTGTSWDFEDIRDYYLNQLYELDPFKLRVFDPEKYMKLSEIVTGEIMSQVFSEWRSQHSECMGGIIWFMKDFWPGAGWGIIDSFYKPKACYFFLKRCWQSINIFFTNESLNGLDVHIINETKKDLDATLEILLINKQGDLSSSKEHKVYINAQSALSFNIENLLGAFCDITYSYRFGPVNILAVSARLVKGEKLISESFFYPQMNNLLTQLNGQIEYEVLQSDNQDYRLKLTANKFVYGVYIETRQYSCNDNYFNLLPGICKEISLKASSGSNSVLKGYISALNLENDIFFRY